MSDSKSMFGWTNWQSFPDPTKGDYLHAPFGPGVYQLRNNKANMYVYCGEGKNTAYRMSSLLPSPLGQGTRNNNELREYVIANLKHITYRTLHCSTKAEAKSMEYVVKTANQHLFDS